jgi:sugar lactone lactonase YvrE
MHQSGRYAAASAPSAAEGWRLERLTPPSALFGANGIRPGADGRLYVAQALGSQISAVDVETGGIETISPMGGGIVGPDDLAFGPEGAIYATELMEGRIGVRETDGRTRVLRGDLPAANGITFHQGRLFVDECRMGGRLVELDLAGGAPRVLVEDIPMANALAMGPDGKLYFPAMVANQIWRVDPAGGPVEVVAGDLGTPDAVKFDAQGYIVSTQVGSGEVLRIDPRTGDRTVLASFEAGLDNLAFMGERLFVSHTAGRIVELTPRGGVRQVLPGGLAGPLDLAFAVGELYVSDGLHLYVLAPGQGLRSVARIFSPGWPGFVRGLDPIGPGQFVVTTVTGQVVRYDLGRAEHVVLASGLEELYGVAVAPGGVIVAADLGAGRVVGVDGGEVEELARGLNKPLGVAIGADGACFVSESGAGRIVKLGGGRAETVLDGLQTPQGLLARDGRLYVVDAGAKALIEHDLATGARRTLAADLPIGAPPGVTPKPLRGLFGKLGPFAGIAAGPAGALYISADADGSVLALRPA